MATKDSAADVLGETPGILKVWGNNPLIKIGDMTFADYSAKVQALETLHGDVEDKELDLSKIRNSRDDNALEVSGLNSRFRSIARGQFGPDSSEYEQVGGTRSSERKSAKKKTTTVAAK
jgi:hypothetical protein